MRDRADVYADMARMKAEELARLEPEAKAARILRDGAIRKAAAAGTPTGVLARLTGLSRAQVARIIEYGKEPS